MFIYFLRKEPYLACLPGVSKAKCNHQLGSGEGLVVSGVILEWTYRGITSQDMMALNNWDFLISLVDMPPFNPRISYWALYLEGYGDPGTSINRRIHEGKPHPKDGIC